MTQPNVSPQSVFVTLRLTPDAQAGPGEPTEVLWAEPLGDDRYRLQDVPLYATDASYGDIVRAREQEGALVVEEIVDRGGHSTYHVRVPPALIDEFHQKYWKSLELLGCTYVGRKGAQYLVAVDVPPETDLRQVQMLLDKGRQRGLWELAAGHLAETP
jgi:hypothetical protein